MELYAPIPFTHFDGADLTVRHPLGDGMLKAKLFGGKTDETLASWSDSDYKLDGGLWGGLAEYQLPKLLFRAGFSISWLDEDFPSLDPVLAALRGSGEPKAIALAEDLRLSQGDYVFLAAGMAYEPRFGN
ncbi:hypothetical protein [Thiorhodococcus minor]|uniref:Uncharacterized protein n=1 Tax=Thiorhodococcus minor TaxID=57489 RepID=A0A6M0K277_9GAMM|nr:hypothetical protein [Thiorhodococcus minor]NEV63858.1 hypothetical protein [Thiorhodococcus minor]